MPRLSGDQNSPDAPSVPSSGRAMRDFSGRTQIRNLRLESAATNASVNPSGEIAALSGSGSKVWPGGALTENLVTSSGERGASQRDSPKAATPSTTTAPAAIANVRDGRRA